MFVRATKKKELMKFYCVDKFGDCLIDLMGMKFDEETENMDNLANLQDIRFNDTTFSNVTHISCF